jgi:hypothetical protein
VEISNGAISVSTNRVLKWSTNPKLRLKSRTSMIISLLGAQCETNFIIEGIKYLNHFHESSTFWDSKDIHLMTEHVS